MSANLEGNFLHIVPNLPPRWPEHEDRVSGKLKDVTSGLRDLLDQELKVTVEPKCKLFRAKAVPFFNFDLQRGCLVSRKARTGDVAFRMDTYI